MEVEDIEKTVLAYLKGKGYRLAELGLQGEKNRCRPPRLLGCLILQEPLKQNNLFLRT